MAAQLIPVSRTLQVTTTVNVDGKDKQKDYSFKNVKQSADATALLSAGQALANVMSETLYEIGMIQGNKLVNA